MLVAPVYSDPWTQTDLLGQAIVVEKPWWSTTHEISGVTCSLYLVRFFFAESLQSHYVDDSTIAEWTDLQIHRLSVASVFPSGYTSSNATELVQTRAPNTSGTWDVFPSLPSWNNEMEFRAFGAWFGFQGDTEFLSWLRIDLFINESLTLGTAPTSLGSIQSTTSPVQYEPLTYNFTTPPDVPPSAQLSFRMRLNMVAGSEYTLVMRIRNPWVATTRIV